MTDYTEDEIKWLREMLNEWMECASYDPTMSGPVFKGWNGSSLSRCMKKTLKYYEWVKARDAIRALPLEESK